jgi:FAD:protein FMN transferase
MNSTPRPLPRRTLLWGAGALSLLAACGPAGLSLGGSAHAFGGLTMGSPYRVVLAGTGLTPALRAAAQAQVAAALDAVDRSMSTYRADSVLTHFNTHAGSAPFALPVDVFAVFELAQQVSALTHGAFDITVGPAVDAWGFGPGRQTRLLAQAELSVLERRVGWQGLALNPQTRSVSKAQPSVRADLSGIAKGFGVDQAAAALDALGLAHYLIDAGGEVRTRGRNAQGQPWQVAIEEPLAGRRRPRYVVPLSDLAMATSGDYRIFFEHDGKRYSHEIDPSTGKPIDNRLTSVTVVASSGALADALGKLIVLGPERGFELASALNLAAHFIIRDPDGRLRDLSTPAFTALGGHAYSA